MFVHTHVYYANRFEPGVLFPDIIRLDYSDPMIAPDLARILDVKLEFSDPVGAESAPVSLSVTEENSFTLQPTYGYIALYYVGAPEDFDLADMIEGYVTVTITDIVNAELPIESGDYIGSVDKDFILSEESTNTYDYPVYTLDISQVYQAVMQECVYTEQSYAKGTVDMGTKIYPTVLSAGVDPNLITPSAININIVIN